MASEKLSQKGFITQAVAKASRATIQTMVMASTLRQDSAGLKMSGSIMKQPKFNWHTKDKFEELGNFRLEVSKVQPNYNHGQAEKYP